jgi:hypothetical protein
MRLFVLIAAAFLGLTQGAFASANLDCSAKDKNVASLSIEAITSRDGKYLDSLRGEVEIETGKPIELTKADVKSHHSEKNIALTLVKRTPQGLLEIRIYAKPAGDGDLDYEGTYVVRLGKIQKGGKVACTAG